MTDEQQIEKPKAGPRKGKARRRRAAIPRAPQPRIAEFAGLTAADCCDACQASRTAAGKAQIRMNELERAYERRPSMDRNSQTVMESDAEWLKRYPAIAEEWLALGRAQLGTCVISGRPGCSHPFKQGLAPELKNDGEVVARYNRAKRSLDHQQINERTY